MMRSRTFITGYWQFMNDRQKQIQWVWCSMKQRCDNPNNFAYKNYGQRGITYCEKWKLFKNFLNDMGIPPKGWTLDRIDNEKGYYLENCAWSKRIAQTKNRRNTKIYEIEGNLYTLKEYANLKKLNYYTLKTRIQKGMSIEESIFDGKYPNNNIYGKNQDGTFMKKDFHGRLCAIEERIKK